jgi:hypothetical protein
MNLYEELYRVGAPLSSRQDSGKAWTYDLKTGQFEKHKAYTFPFTRMMGRGNIASKYPNATFDASCFVLNVKSEFWNIHSSILSTNHTLSLFVHSFLSNPPTPPSDLGFNDWLILVFGGKLLSTFTVGQECYTACWDLFRQRLIAPGADSEPSLLSGTDGIGKQKARLQPQISGIGTSNKNAFLFSVNEGANEFLGTSQGYNYLITLDEAVAVTRGASFLLENSAIQTANSSVILIPEAGVEHPIIPILKGILGFGFVENREEIIPRLWSELESLPEDSSMARMSLRNRGTITVSQLKANVLRSRAELKIAYTLRSTLVEERDVVVVESICEETLWAILMGLHYPNTLAQLNYDRYPKTTARWLQAIYYQENGILPQKEQSEIMTSLTFDTKNFAQEIDGWLEIMNSAIVAPLQSEDAYTWGRLIASYDMLRSSYHYAAARGVKTKPPVGREIRNIRSNPLACISSMSNARLYETKASIWFKIHYQSIRELMTKIPQTQLTHAQMALVLLGDDHQRIGMWRFIRQSKSLPITDSTATNTIPIEIDS